MKDSAILALAATGAALAVLVADHLKTPFDSIFDSEARLAGVDSNLLRALARIESSFRPDAVGPTGDRGLLQLSPPNLRRFGLTDQTSLDPRLNVAAGARMVLENTRTLQRAGKLSRIALAASWNVGPDLKPSEIGAAYGARVLWHWQLYDLGRAFA